MAGRNPQRGRRLSENCRARQEEEEEEEEEEEDDDDGEILTHVITLTLFNIYDTVDQI